MNAERDGSLKLRLSCEEARHLEARIARDLAQLEDAQVETTSGNEVLAYEIEQLRRVDARLRGLLAEPGSLPDLV
jgi:hypothetical protein